MSRITTSDNGGIDDDDTNLLYCEKPEWQDVVPIPQYESGVNPITPIFYTPEYKDATEYFRAVVKNEEISERVLQLTLVIIRMNPAHYSAWQYRYKSLISLGRSLDAELELMDEIAMECMKNYQVWHHRRLILTALHDSQTSSSSPSPPPPTPTSLIATASKELSFITEVLGEDHKNYHTWSYRQWLLAFFDDESLWEGELPYVEKLLDADVRNNSAWHHRYFVVFGRVRARGEVDHVEVLTRELAYTKEKIALAPNNPSAWNYLRGILDHTNTPHSTLQSFVELYTTINPPANQQTGDDSVIDLDNPKPGPGAQLPCVAALEFLADVYEKAGGEQINKAVEIWKSLADQYDKTRKKYWEFRVKEALKA